MRVGIDVTPLLRARTGVGVLTEMLVRSVLAGGDQVIGLVSGYRLLAGGRLKLDVPVAPNFVPRILNPVFLDVLRWPTVESLLGRCDVFIATNYLVPPARRAHNLAFVHDVGRLVQPHLFGRRQVMRFRFVMRRGARFAELFLVPSEAVRDEIVRLRLVPESRIRVVPLGVRELPEGGGDGVDGITRGAPMVLCVSTLERRKNLPFLLRAFARAAPRMPHHLVVAGAIGGGGVEVLRAARTNGASERIHFLGHVEATRLAALYRGASFSVCPSLYEGFGLPLLEAMASGCPVLASDIAAHREVAGDAARLVAPADEARFADTLVEFAADAGARTEYRERGLLRSGAFTWQRTSDRLREVLTRLG